MKKLLLASVIAIISLPAQAAPTIYGKAFLLLDYTNGDEDTTTTKTTNVNGGEPAVNVDNQATSLDDTKLNSKSSRIGIKGSESINADSDLIYQLEYGVDVDSDSDDDDQFYARDTFLGLESDSYGTFKAGHLTSIDDYVDFADILDGTKNVAQKAGPSFNEPRANNSFNYISPEFNGITMLAMYGLDEDNDDDDANFEHEEKYGVGAMYTTGPINLGATYIGYGDVNHMRVSAGYELSSELSAGAMYQMSDYDTDDNEHAMVVSAEKKTATPWTVYTQLNYKDNIEGMPDNEAIGVGVGGKYKLTKAATGHLYVGYLSTDSMAVDKDKSDEVVVIEGESDSFGIGAGVEYKF